MQDACIICGGKPLERIAADRTLNGTTFRADALHPFSLLRCAACGHIQKTLDAAWHGYMRDLYEKAYRKILRQINFENGKIQTRDSAAVRQLDSVLQLPEHGALLDAGCGEGTFLAAFFAEKPGWKVTGQDVSALNADKVLAIPSATFHNGALSAIDRQFDLITFNHVIEHLTAPVDALRAAADLLAPGGFIVGRVPCFLSVHTDFYLLEHCSHFTARTLETLANVAGLSVIRDFAPAAIEIGFIAQKSSGSVAIEADDANEAQALRCLDWAERIPGFVRRHAKGRKVGVFGVGGAGIWLGAALRGVIDFYVDDDPSKQGDDFAGCPIVGADAVPQDAVVCVAFNNPDASARICERLRARRPDVEFLMPRD